MGKRLELVDRLLHPLRCGPREPRDGDGGEQVLEVVAPDEAGPNEVVSLLASRGEPERDAAVHAEGPVRAGGHAERDDLRCEAAREVPRRRVVAVQDREVVRLLTCEQAGLGRDVPLERPVAVEMIGGDVQEAADPGPKALHPFELEARHLGDGHLGVGPDGGDERRAEVPPHEGPPTRADEGQAGEARRRALPVGAGDRDHGTAEQPRGDLDLAPDRNAAAEGRRQERHVARDPGTRDDEVDAAEQIEALLAEPQLDARPGVGGDAELRRPPPVGGPHADAARREGPGDRLAGTLEPQHERLARTGHQRSFSVDNASSAQTIDTIQNRTMICGSGHPRSSK